MFHPDINYYCYHGLLTMTDCRPLVLGKHKSTRVQSHNMCSVYITTWVYMCVHRAGVGNCVLNRCIPMMMIIPNRVQQNPDCNYTHLYSSVLGSSNTTYGLSTGSSCVCMCSIPHNTHAHMHACAHAHTHTHTHTHIHTHTPVNTASWDERRSSTSLNVHLLFMTASTDERGSHVL